MKQFASVNLWILLWSVVNLSCQGGVDDSRASAGFDSSPRAAEAYRLRARAEQAYEAKRYVECARLYVELGGYDTPDRDDDELSSAACLSRKGDLEAARAHLRLATDHGYRNLSQLQTLDDFAPLRGDRTWQDIVERTTRNHEQYLAGANRELYDIYAADQADRAVARYEDLDWKAVRVRDGDRRARVIELMRHDAARVAADYIHAAMILQHGNSPADYELAKVWAEQAARMKPADPRARWLVVATTDRFLMSSGKPQKYGTQFRKVNGQWTVYDVDPAVTDEQRMAWKAPPLDVARAHVEQLNAAAAAK